MLTGSFNKLLSSLALFDFSGSVEIDFALAKLSPTGINFPEILKVNEAGRQLAGHAGSRILFSSAVIGDSVEFEHDEIVFLRNSAKQCREGLVAGGGAQRCIFKRLTGCAHAPGKGREFR